MHAAGESLRVNRRLSVYSVVPGYVFHGSTNFVHESWTGWQPKNAGKPARLDVDIVLLYYKLAVLRYDLHSCI